MHCTNCGEPLAEQAKFCASCGGAVATETRAPKTPERSKDDKDITDRIVKNPIFLVLVALGALLFFKDMQFWSGGSGAAETPKSGADTVARPATNTVEQPAADIARTVQPVPLDANIVPEDKIGLRVYLLKDARSVTHCNIHSEAFNNTPVTWENLHLKVRIFDESNNLIETEDWWYSNIRPGKSVAHTISIVENVPCEEIGKLVTYDIRQCKFGDTNYTASFCESFLSFPSGQVEWSL